MAKILAFDPGVTTGYIIKRDGPLLTGQLQGEHHAGLWCMLHDFQPDIVICESFTYQRRGNVVLKSVEYIGVISLYCQSTNTPLRMQSPSQAKNLWTDEKLKAVNLYKGSSPHSNDATRHLLYYLTVHEKDMYWINLLREE